MTISESLLPEYDQETASTRRLLERVPDGRLSWSPHPKSMPLGALATHLANLPQWTVYTLERTSLDVAPPGEKPMRAEPVTSGREALAKFDQNVAAGRKAIEKATDADWAVSWSLLAAGQEIFTIPRLAAVRSFVLNHLIHHRAQLGVYLRLNDVPLPQIYGPTADES